MTNRSATQQGLRVHPFDPLCAPGARLERIPKILCFPCNLVAAELHDAHGVGWLTVICQDVFGDPKITAANDSPPPIRCPLCPRKQTSAGRVVMSCS